MEFSGKPGASEGRMKSLIWFFVALMTVGMLPFDSAVASVEEQHECRVQGLLECRYNTVSEWEYDGCVEQVGTLCRRRFAPSSSSSSPSEISPRSSSGNDSSVGTLIIFLFVVYLLMKLLGRGGRIASDSNDSSYESGGPMPEFAVYRDHPADCIVCGRNTSRLSEEGRCVDCINP